MDFATIHSRFLWFHFDPYPKTAVESEPGCLASHSATGARPGTAPAEPGKRISVENLHRNSLKLGVARSDGLSAHMTSYMTSEPL